MKTSKALGLLIIVLEIGGIVFLLLCGQTLLAIIGTATSGGQIPTEIDQATGVARLTFTADPKNGGYLPAILTIGFRRKHQRWLVFCQQLHDDQPRTGETGSDNYYAQGPTG